MVVDKPFFLASSSSSTSSAHDFLLFEVVPDDSASCSSFEFNFHPLGVTASIGISELSGTVYFT
jgi:hypothetical protein